MFHITCPSCGGMIEVIEVNCGIFRHGDISPHASKEECDRFAALSLYGCGKPFRVIQENGVWRAVSCDYL